jgi:hypothetical protein
MFVSRAKNKTKEMWQIINKEVGNSKHYDYKTDLGNGNEIISKPQNISHRLNSFFVKFVASLLNQHNNPTINSTPKHSTSVQVVHHMTTHHLLLWHVFQLPSTLLSIPLFRI